MTLATGGNMCLQCSGSRAAERREENCRGCVAVVSGLCYREATDSSDLLGLVNILHAVIDV